jgi:hypothetical protein
MVARVGRRSAPFAIAGVILVSLLPQFAPNAGATGAWGSAVEAPATAGLNAGGDALVLAQSCGASGNCGAIGYYEDASGNYSAFVENEVGGEWGATQEVPGLAALNIGGDVGGIMAISCSGLGSCSAGGAYTDGAGNLQSFVVNEANGTWSNAEEVPGFSSLNGTGPGSGLFTISCSSPGNCGAGGAYVDMNNYLQAYVENEVNGSWQTAIEVPGTNSLNYGNKAALTAIQCNVSGACSATGTYQTSQSNSGTFVVNEAGGTWQSASALPQSGLTNITSGIVPIALSCTSVGNCSMGGAYGVSATQSSSFVANEIGGTWQSAAAVQNLGQAQVASASTTVLALSCSTNGNCSATGIISGSANTAQVFVVSEVDGTWQGALGVPSLIAENTGDDALGEAISCVSPGNCTIGGYFSDSSNNQHAFVLDQLNGAWGSVIEVPGSSALNAGGGAAVNAIVCSADDSCSLSGGYTDGSNNLQVFVDTSAAAFFVPSAPSISASSSKKGTIKVSLLGAPNDNGSVVTGYQYSINGGVWVNLSPTQLPTFRVGKLKDGKSYRIEVRAVNAVGDGSVSRSVDVKVK